MQLKFLINTYSKAMKQDQVSIAQDLVQKNANISENLADEENISSFLLGKLFLTFLKRTMIR